MYLHWCNSRKLRSLGCKHCVGLGSRVSCCLSLVQDIQSIIGDFPAPTKFANPTSSTSHTPAPRLLHRLSGRENVTVVETVETRGGSEVGCQMDSQYSGLSIDIRTRCNMSSGLLFFLSLWLQSSETHFS